MFEEVELRLHEQPHIIGMGRDDREQLTVVEGAHLLLEYEQLFAEVAVDKVKLFELAFKLQLANLAVALIE